MVGVCACVVCGILTYLLGNIFGERAALRLRDSVLKSLNAAQEWENDFADKKAHDVPNWNDGTRDQFIQLFFFRFRNEIALYSCWYFPNSDKQLKNRHR